MKNRVLPFIEKNSEKELKQETSELVTITENKCADVLSPKAFYSAGRLLLDIQFQTCDSSPSLLAQLYLYKYHIIEPPIVQEARRKVEKLKSLLLFCDEESLPYTIPVIPDDPAKITAKHLIQLSDWADNLCLKLVKPDQTFNFLSGDIKENNLYRQIDFKFISGGEKITNSKKRIYIAGLFSKLKDYQQELQQSLIHDINETRKNLLNLAKFLYEIDEETTFIADKMPLLSENPADLTPEHIHSLNKWSLKLYSVLQTNCSALLLKNDAHEASQKFTAAEEQTYFEKNLYDLVHQVITANETRVLFHQQVQYKSEKLPICSGTPQDQKPNLRVLPTGISQIINKAANLSDIVRIAQAASNNKWLCCFKPIGRTAITQEFYCLLADIPLGHLNKRSITHFKQSLNSWLKKNDILHLGNSKKLTRSPH